MATRRAPTRGGRRVNRAVTAPPPATSPQDRRRAHEHLRPSPHTATQTGGRHPTHAARLDELRAMTSAGAAVTAAALTATLGLAAAAWVLAVRQMRGMDLGVATGLGSLAFFAALWVSMMAAM